jgi:hypothetical protein
MYAKSETPQRHIELVLGSIRMAQWYDTLLMYT